MIGSMILGAAALTLICDLSRNGGQSLTERISVTKLTEGGKATAEYWVDGELRSTGSRLLINLTSKAGRASFQLVDGTGTTDLTKQADGSFHIHETTMMPHPPILEYTGSCVRAEPTRKAK